MLNSIDKWHKTKLGLLVFGLVELGLAYIFASFAIDSGSLWDYLFTLIFTVGFLRNLFMLIGSLFHGTASRRNK